MLQVLDECDDAGAALSQWWLGARRGILLLCLGLACCAIAAAVLYLGAWALILAGAALAASTGAAFSMRRRFALIP